MTRARLGRWLALVCLVAVLSIGGLAGLGWAAITRIDDGMSSVKVQESKEGARSMAERMGLALANGDRIEYGEVASSFPDSSAYLVVTASSADRLAQIIRESGFPEPTSVGAEVSLRPPDRHGPEPSPTLVRSETLPRNGDYLIARWDPQRAPHTLYVDAIET